MIAKDFAKSGQISLSKALLDSLAEDENCTGFELYCKYFENFCLVDEEANLSCLKSCGKAVDRIRKHLYKKSDPGSEPCYFSFYSHHDVNRMGKMLKQEIVVYCAKTVESILEDNRQSIYVLHDFRCLNFAMCQPKIKTYLFCSATKSLYSLSGPLNLKHASCFFGETLSSYRPEKTENWTEALDRAVLGSRYKKDKNDNHLRLQNLTQVQRYSRQLYERWGNKTVLLTGFCRYTSTGNWTKKKCPSKCYFVTLALIHDSDLTSPLASKLEELSFDNCIVLSVYNYSQICRLNRVFSEHVLKSLRDTTGAKERLCGRQGPHQFKKANLSDRLQAKKAWKEMRQARKRKRRESLVSDPDAPTFHSNRSKKSSVSRSKICKCSICLDTKFSENMAFSGPEKLCSTEYTVSDLLKILGEWNRDVEALVEKLCSMSVGAMDIESRTCSADVGKSTDGNCFTYGEILADIKMEGHVKKVQKPLMIAHLDGLDLLSDSLKRPDAAVEVFTVESDSEESIYAMMKDYWDHVLLRQKAVREAKIKVAEPLYRLTNQYRKVFFEYSCKWLDDSLEKIKKSQQKYAAKTFLEKAGKSTKRSRCSSFKEEIDNSNPDETEAPPTDKEEEEEEEDYVDDPISVYNQLELATLQSLAEKFEVKQSQLVAAWRATLPGKLEAGLDRLIEQYEIFSFYG